MRTLFAALLLALQLGAASALAQNPLRDAVAQGSGRIAWTIRTDGVSICCCNDSESLNIGREKRVQYENIVLVATLRDRQIVKLRMVEPACPVTDARIVENVSADASLDFLLPHVSGTDHVIAAIAMHDHPRTVTELIALARKHESTEVRRDAIFWLGQRAGEKVAGELRRAVDEDPEDEVRERAVFAISQLPAERAVPMLVDLVKNHKRPVVRKRAMFWLTQTGDPRALQLIEEILAR
jgi:HEAT repeat protein